MANFEAFCGTKKLISNLFFLKSVVNYCISLNTFTHTLKFVIDLHSLKKKYFTELMKIWNGKYHKFLDLDGMPSMISNISGHP